MPEMKHNFQRGRMNKDLDERLVPDGEYREALNVEVLTSEGSNAGSLETMMGNTLISQIDPQGNHDFECVGSIEDSRHNKLYWFVSGNGIDMVVEFDYITSIVTPVCVDVFAGNVNRVLKFDKKFHITGLNIMDGVLYWTDNNSEPKKINIERLKAGTLSYTAQSTFMVKDVAVNAIPGTYVHAGIAFAPLDIREEHLTIIKKGPPAAPMLEMRDTTLLDTDNDGLIGGGELIAPINPVSFINPADGEFLTNITITTLNDTDFIVGQYLTIFSADDSVKRVRAIVDSETNNDTYVLTIFSGNKEIEGEEELMVKVEQSDPLFHFKFPRFATRYKYEDGEYSAFSPFTEVAFLPGKFDYMTKEGYNLGMVNNLRRLAIKNFVYPKAMPEDVVAIDILYKESNSSNIYSVKQVKRLNYDPISWDCWNGDSSNTVAEHYTKGYLPITSEMIHAVLPANQLLRPWDNVPRKALAQEIIGNRLVYGNYLQNYNLENQYTGEHNIKVDLNLSYKSIQLGDNFPEEIHAGGLLANKYNPAKSIKSLRTYQVGVVYIDKYGRETPVLSEDTRGSSATTLTSESSIYMPKEEAAKKTALSLVLENNPPEWATHYKVFIKETSNEYYNLAMDRWYDAEDDNIWLSFPSAERNKVDEETFLVLKKEHDNDIEVLEPARYKIIAIENEAPRYIKLQDVSLGALQDVVTTTDVVLGFGGDMSTFPYEGSTEIYIDKDAFTAAGYLESIVNQDISMVYFRIKTGSAISSFYKLKQVSFNATAAAYILHSTKVFESDMSITSPTGLWEDRVTNCELQIIKRVPEDKAEFEGRFFVKILKDYTLIDKLGTSGTMTTDYVVKMARKVQYIHPRTSWSNSAGNGWYGYGVPWNKVSVSKSEKDAFGGNTTRADLGFRGEGQKYWKHASFYDNPDIPSASKGWFIDFVEGFVPFDNTKEQFGQDTGKRWGVKQNPANFGNCFWDVGRNAMEDSPPPYMQKALGLNTYGDSWSNTNYLGAHNPGPYKGIRPPVKKNGDNTVQSASATNNGGKGPNKGITDNHMYLSYSGILEEGLSNDSGHGKTSWSSLKMAFGTAVKHAADVVFINKLIQTGAIFSFAEDPGEVLYMVKQLEPSFDDEKVDNMDGQLGIAQFNYVRFGDYWKSRTHFERSACDCVVGPVTLWTAGGDYWKDGIVSRSKKSTHTPNWKSGDMWNDYGQGGCDCIHPVYGWLGGGTQAIAGTGIKAHCPETHNDDVDAASKHISAGGEFDSHHVWPVGVYDWNTAYNKRRRFIIKAVPIDSNGQDILVSGVVARIGGVAPHYYKPTNNPNNDAHFHISAVTSANPLGIITANPNTGASFDDPLSYPLETGWAPGVRADGMHSGYAWPDGAYYYDQTNTEMGPNGDNTYSDIPLVKRWDSRATAVQSPAPGSVTWQIKEYWVQDADDNSYSSTNPAIWETEPKEDVGLDIYYEVGQIYPIELNDRTIEQYVGAVQVDITKNSYVTINNNVPLSVNTGSSPLSDVRVIDAQGSKVILGAWNGSSIEVLSNNSANVTPLNGDTINFHRADGSITSARVISGPGLSHQILLDPNVHTGIQNKKVLPWFNCYSFGNGVESDRIRDDYNQVKIDNGPKASTTMEGTYLEERRCSGFIWSGLYNSNSGVNDLNQFIQAEAITKDVNPGYGCIQKMHARDNDLVAFCEDRVLKVHANKDALFNADGNTNLVATNKVLGAVKPFSGDYGISKNPESFASDSHRTYFADASRGAVVRLSQDGLTPISSAGMQDWFSDILPKYAKISDHKIIGSFDDKKQEYNITLTTDGIGGFGPCGPDDEYIGTTARVVDGAIIQDIEDEINYTLSYNEKSKGWSSFRSYLQESGVSLNNEYFTFKGGNLYAHHTNELRNNYYGNQYDSYVTVLMNRGPSVVKSFTTIGYEGSQARISQDTNNPDYYDNITKRGWYVGGMATDLQEVETLEFKAKENKYFSQIRGVQTVWTEDGLAGNIDPKEFSFQGIGNSNLVSCPHCGPTVSWNCQGTPCECVQVPGSQGQYPTQLACQNDTTGCCGEDIGWCFANEVCVETNSENSEYDTLCECIEENFSCDLGQSYIEDCLGITLPPSPITGCMDDGITSDPFITQNRPAGWVGPAANYDAGASIPDCSCIYETPETFDCVDGDCVDPQDGSGEFTGVHAYLDCINDCADPCERQTMGLENITVNPTPTGPPNNPCETTASDGSVQVMVTNTTSSAAVPFTSWTYELWDSTTTGPPQPNALIYSDPNTYATGTYSNVYVGLTTISYGTSAAGIYYVKITDNNGCEYGPFVITINCGEEQCVGFVDNGCCAYCEENMDPSEECYDFCENWWSANSWENCCELSVGEPCDDYPGDLVFDTQGQTCCGKCDQFAAQPGHPCYDFCNEWGDCCDTNPCEDYPGDLLVATYPMEVYCCENCATAQPGDACYDFCVEWGDCCDTTLQPTYCEGESLGNWVPGNNYNIGDVVYHNAGAAGSGYFTLMNYSTTGLYTEPTDMINGNGWVPCGECVNDLGQIPGGRFNLNPGAPMINGFGFGDEFCCGWNTYPMYSTNPTCGGSNTGEMKVYMPSGWGDVGGLPNLAGQQGNFNPSSFVQWRNANGDFVGHGGCTDMSDWWCANTVGDDTMINMPAGAYTAEVFNCDGGYGTGIAGQPYNNCSQPGCSRVMSFLLEDPVPLDLGNNGYTYDLTLPPGTGGAIIISPNGGTLPYYYLWSNGATTQNISGLGVGPYSVVVTDSAGCSVSGNWFVLA